MSDALANKIYLLRNTGSGKYLNVWGIDQVGNNRNVNQYDLSAELSQLFWVQKTASGVFKLTSVITGSGATYYSLNINGSTNNANLYMETVTNDMDSSLEFTQVQGDTYRIALKQPRSDGSTLYLSAIGDSNGTSSTLQTEGNVVWAAQNCDAYQVWELEYLAPYEESYDLRKLDTQVFLHKFYGSNIEINAKAGTALCTELVKALQKILLNIADSDPGYGSFGPATLAACPTLFSGMASTEQNKKLVTLFCHALFCKGYSPVSISDSYNANVAAGVKDFQHDAGLAETGIATPAQIKAIFNTDSYVLSSKGDSRVREIQQAMNGQYSDYSGINPCDGIYSRATNNALIYAVQKEEGISVENSAPSFGPSTFSKFPTLPFTGDAKEEGCNETALTKILQYALYVNGYYGGAFDGTFSSAVVSGVRAFQTFMAYPAPITDYADARVMKGLLASCGDQTRSCTACDTATILSAATAEALYNSGYRYVGRYLTGTVRTANGTITSKALTRQEAETILNAGLSIIPIFQDGGEYRAHFSEARGMADAEQAYAAAKALGIPNGSVLYFAVDFDALGTDIDRIAQYFKALCFNISDYQVGIYGTRNICSSVVEKGWAFRCYVSDMSTGYSGNLGYRMPASWAFDQFASATVNGVEIDKVACSGADVAVSQLWDNNLTDQEYQDAALNAAVHSKICDFQEDFPALLLATTGEEADDPEESMSNLPDFSVSRSWSCTLVNQYNMRIEYEVSVGASLDQGDSLFTMSVSNGSISVSDQASLVDALTAAGYGNSGTISQTNVLNLFKGVATSVKAGQVSISVSTNVVEKTVTVAITCSTPNLEVTDDLTVAFSQKISVILKSGNVATPNGNVDLTWENMVAALSTEVASSAKVLGNALATLFSTIGNSGFSAGMDESDGFAMVLLGVLTMLVVGVFGVLA